MVDWSMMYQVRMPNAVCGSAVRREGRHSTCWARTGAVSCSEYTSKCHIELWACWGKRAAVKILLWSICATGPAGVGCTEVTARWRVVCRTAGAPHDEPDSELWAVPNVTPTPVFSAGPTASTMLRSDSVGQCISFQHSKHVQSAFPSA